MTLQEILDKAFNLDLLCVKEELTHAFHSYLLEWTVSWKLPFQIPQGEKNFYIVVKLLEEKIFH